MNTNGNGVDHLTRELLKSTIQYPTPDLSKKIMNRIAQETPVIQQAKTHVKLAKYSPWIIITVIVYLLVMLLFFYWLQTTQIDGGLANELIDFSVILKEKLPYILTVIAMVGAIPFFSTFDKSLS